MAKTGLEKRLESLERRANVRNTDRVRVFFQDGSVEEMDVLRLLCKVAFEPKRPVSRYEVLGVIKAGKLLQLVDQILE